MFEGFSCNENRMINFLILRYKEKFNILNNNYYIDYINYFKEIKKGYY